MISSKYVGLVLLLAIPLMGMKCTASGKIECSGGACTKTGEVNGEWEWLRGAPLINKVMAMTEPLDAAAWAVDISQSTVTVPSSGQVILRLIDSSTGTTTASRAFSWSKVGTKLKLSAPDAVNDWAMQYGGSADSMEYETLPFTTSENPGWNTLRMADTYDGVVQAVATRTWQGGQTCPNDPLGQARHCP